MVKESKKALVPKLRFPEFRNSEEWKRKPLSAVLDYERPEKYIVSDTAYQASGIPVLTANKSFVLGYTHETTGIFTDTPVVIFDDFTTDKKYIDFPFKVKSSAIKILRVKGDDSLKLIFELMGSIKFDPKEHKRYYISEYQNLEIALPNGAEQQKIADCLSSLDELIAAQGRKVEALKTYKRGLMQQLFPREGETLPGLRFPEFRDAPEWEKVPLGDIAEIKLGKMLDANKHNTGRLLPYINNISLRWNEVELSNLPQMYFDDDELERYGLKAGDVLVCEGGEPGRSAVWDGRLPELKFQKAIHRVRFSIPFEPRLLVFYLEAVAGTTAFESLFTGGGIKHLTLETFSRFQIPGVPLAEQRRITDFLSSLGGVIAAEVDKLGALNNHKKGLMQQLFPSLEEA